MSEAQIEEYERQFGSKSTGAVWRLRRFVYTIAPKDPLLLEAWNFYKEKIASLVSDKLPGYIVLKRQKNSIIFELHIGAEVYEFVYPPSQH